MPKGRRIEPKPGEESVWDYPRPPRLEKVSEHLRVVFNAKIIAETSAGFRVLETSHPPVYYFAPSDVRTEILTLMPGKSWCEYKGTANYWSLAFNDRHSQNAAWSYPSPTPPFRDIAGYFAFYPSRVDECWVGDERVKAQEGDFYGGWITSRVVGPFKGGSGTLGW